MKNVILFDNEVWDNLLPLTYTRPVGEIRVGILTIREKWEKWADTKVSFITQEHLSQKYPMNIEDDNIVINGSLLPLPGICKLIEQMEPNEALLHNDELMAARLNKSQFQSLIEDEEIEELKGFPIQNTPLLKINNLWDIFGKNEEAIKLDFELLTKNRTSQPISNTNRVTAPEQIFLEPGATVEHATLNASKGPIYIGKDAEIMEGCLIRGPLAMNEKSILKMGAKIYGATTLGPFCKVGGEVNNVVFTGYSNKGHDGFLGNSVIGEWCNLGADTNASNMKNNYAEVKLWSYATERFVKTGLQFCGLIMGDHAKCGINTMFNTGTVIGVSANVYGGGYPRNFIPSFSWGGDQKYTTYTLEKALDTARIMMKRRDIELTETDQEILKEIFGTDRTYRSWEKAILQ